MAESVALKLKIAGNDVAGETTIVSSGGEDRTDTIECVYFEQSTNTPRDPSAGRSSVGARQHHPIKIRKRIDKSSPLLMQALCRNERCDGEFSFFRPNPEGDGTTQFFYKVAIEQARITSVKLWLPDTLEQANSHEPPLEEVEFTFNRITWTCVSGSTEASDDWQQR
jgi:type VI secretion system secreted protein Hcp